MTKVVEPRQMQSILIHNFRACMDSRVHELKKRGANIASAYDYYPFGMHMPGRYVTDTTTQKAIVTQQMMVPILRPKWHVAPNWGVEFVKWSGSEQITYSDTAVRFQWNDAAVSFQCETVPNIEERIQIDISNLILGSSSYLDGFYIIIEDSLGTVESYVTYASGSHLIQYVSRSSKVKVWLTSYGECTVDLTGIMINERAWVPKMLTYEISNNAGDYRFGFNGMMKDNEMKGIGNSYEYGMRMYDSRIGRPFTPDPLFRKFPMLSTYQFFSNNPILNVDLDGLEGISYREIKMDEQSGLVTPIRRVIEADVYIAVNEKGTSGAYKSGEMNRLMYTMHTKHNEQPYRDESGLAVFFKFNFKTFDPENINPAIKAREVAKSLIPTNTTFKDLPDQQFTTLPGAVIWQDPDLNVNGRQSNNRIRINPNRGIYPYGQAENHEMTHFFLMGAGRTMQSPNPISEDQQHNLGGWMQYGTRNIGERGNTISIIGVDNNLNQQTAEQIIQAVPRVDDKIVR